MSSQSSNIDPASVVVYGTSAQNLSGSLFSITVATFVSSPQAYPITVVAGSSSATISNATIAGWTGLTGKWIVITPNANGNALDPATTNFPGSGGSAYSIYFVPLLVTAVASPIVTFTLPVTSPTSGTIALNATTVISGFTASSPVTTFTTAALSAPLGVGLPVSISVTAGTYTNLNKLTAAIIASSTSTSHTVSGVVYPNGGSATVTVGTITQPYGGVVSYSGSGYKVGNSIGVKGDTINGTSPANDMTISVSEVNAVGGITGLFVSGTTPPAIGSDAPLVTNFLITMDMAFGQKFLRDASDRTRALRERLIYNEKRAGTNITPGTPGLGRGHAETLWQQQGNNFRMAYLTGKMKCGAAFGGAYNLNGPNSFKNGAQSGS
jgi:hypothetical protein